MKLLLILLMSLSLSGLPILAQDCAIALSPVVMPASDGSYYPQVNNYLTNRIRLLASNNMTAGSLVNDQFALAVGYDIIDKQIVSGSPTKIIYQLYVNLNIVDLKNRRVFASYSKELKGVGDNETKALINTFQKLNVNNPDIKAFVQQGVKQIIDYYDNNYTSIIKAAQTKSAMKNFDAAIYQLMMIPECSKGYEAALQELKVVYQQFVDQHCNENIAQARAAWMASPNADGAVTASVYLSEIYPDAACYQEAVALANEIKQRMGEEWKFMMRQWEDNISLERQRINAMRDISIAYANAQPQKIENNIFWK